MKNNSLATKIFAIILVALIPTAASANMFVPSFVQMISAPLYMIWLFIPVVLAVALEKL
jgi:hypothetical protein